MTSKMKNWTQDDFTALFRVMERYRWIVSPHVRVKMEDLEADLKAMLRSEGK